MIDNLENDEALVGADVASALSLKEGASLTVLGQAFKVTAVLPQTGTVDDSRVFAHLHRVQDLAGKGPVVNAIEIVGCCQEISNGLVQKINTLAARGEGGDDHADRRRADQDEPHDVAAVLHLPGDHSLRGRCGDRQLHVCERVRAATRDRHADGAWAPTPS